MVDVDWRRLERRYVESGDVSVGLRLRAALRRAGQDAGLDLCLPHGWGVVPADRLRIQDYGTVLNMLRGCVNDCKMPFLHPGIPASQLPSNPALPD